MRKIHIFLVFITGWIATTMLSCNTQTFTVYGEPGTMISNYSEQIGIIDQSGKVKIRTSRKERYQHFYLAQAPGSNVKVPFALDYKDVNRVAIHNAGLWLNIIPLAGQIASITITASLYGSDFLYLSDEAILRQQYNYLKHQSTNNDLIR